MTANDNESDLLFIIPFTVTVKLRSFNFIHSNTELNIKLFINRDDIDMSNIHDIAPIQQFVVSADSDGTNDYNVKVHKFNMSNTLIMYCRATNNESINVSYICIKGDKTNDRRDIVHAVYEARAIPEDHTASDEVYSRMNMSTAPEAGYFK